MKKQTYKKMFNIALTTTLAAGAVVAVAPQAEAAISFKDVKETNTHYANIMNLAERGIIKGYEDGTFRPGNSIKRGNAAHIIAEIIGLDTTNVNNPNFKDITTKNSNYGAIAALANAGIINGFEDGTYRANDNLTRGQMAKIIANAFKLTSNGQALPFTDIENSQYKENIAALFANNVTTGVTSTLFDAKSFVTRGQLSSFVVRAEKAVETEPTPAPTPNPGPVIPTPTPEQPGIPTPTAEQSEFINNLEEKLESLNGKVENVQIDVKGTAVEITGGPSLTKEELAAVSGDVINSFMGLGTTALVDSITIGTKIYTSQDYLTADLKEIAANLALAIGIDVLDGLEIQDPSYSGNVWDALSNSTYSDTVYLNFKENNLRVPLAITLTERVN